MYCQLLSGFIWLQLGTVPRNFVLYGGTALALRLGHRQSVDFDFFCNEVFAPEQLFSAMNLPRDSRVDQRGDNTLSVFVNEVKLSFFGDVRMNRVHDPDVADNGLQVASLLDLIATKLKTIQQRAEAKDYEDLAAALGAGIKLEEALAAAIAVFGPKFNVIASAQGLDVLRRRKLEEAAAWRAEPVADDRVSHQYRKHCPVSQLDLESLHRTRGEPSARAYCSCKTGGVV